MWFGMSQISVDQEAAESLSYTCCLDLLIRKQCDWEHQVRTFFFFCLSRKENCLCPSNSHRIVLTESVFHSLKVRDAGQYQSLLSSPYFDNSLSGKSEAIPNCNFGHICCHEWGYGKYVMWPSKELLDYIQFRNKGSLVQTDRNKDQTALPLCPCWHRAHSGPHLSFSQLELLLTTL